jgi:hypothetical protein
MGVTSNGLPYPENSDFVADGAMAIKDLADNVNSKAGLWKVIPSGATNGTVGANGDVTIGSAVSSVTVDGAFSSKYEAYMIIISGGAGSGTASLRLRFGATVTGYWYGVIFGAGYNTASGTAGQSATNTGVYIDFMGYMSANGITAEIMVNSPQLAKRTIVSATLAPHADNLSYGWTNGVVPNNTQYTSFNILPSSGTMTGGTIRIYGFNK